MRRKRARQTHTVKINLQVFELSKAGTSLEVEIMERGRKLGDLTIGRGSIIWHGRNRQSDKRITWTRFARMMDELAYGP